ncbi:hypothetical protein LCGC14_2069660, partial [marine sediment metagenome]
MENACMPGWLFAMNEIITFVAGIALGAVVFWG